jgi:hypothetical protein
LVTMMTSRTQTLSALKAHLTASATGQRKLSPRHPC